MTARHFLTFVDHQFEDRRLVIQTLSGFVTNHFFFFPTAATGAFCFWHRDEILTDWNTRFVSGFAWVTAFFLRFTRKAFSTRVNNIFYVLGSRVFEEGVFGFQIGKQGFFLTFSIDKTFCLPSEACTHIQHVLHNHRVYLFLMYAVFLFHFEA